ncbi:GPCR fungal pheromone mating factor [Abortiporus biennis]|nr:GPCR fungal pheromone mating factor [Abortiporus biennis]
MSTSWIIEQYFLTVFSFLAMVLVLIPLPLMWNARNVGAILYIFWSVVLNLLLFVNFNVWRGNVENSAPVWCDIAVRLAFAGQLGTISAAIVIARRVSIIVRGALSFDSMGASNRRRDMIIDLAIGLSVPVAQMIIFPFVQSNRFDIWGSLGCQPGVPTTIPLIVLTTTWPIIMGLISLYYSSITLHTLYIRGAFSRQGWLIAKRTKNMDCYYRLLAITLIDVWCTVPLGAYNIYASLKQAPIRQWHGLADLHQNFGTVNQIPEEIWTADHNVRSLVEFSSWAPIIVAWIFVILFGFSGEIYDFYIQTFLDVRRKLGFVYSKPEDPEKVVEVVIHLNGIPSHRCVFGGIS